MTWAAWGTMVSKVDAINQLDEHHQQLARETLEAITLRAAANRWQQPA